MQRSAPQAAGEPARRDAQRDRGQPGVRVPAVRRRRLPPVRLRPHRRARAAGALLRMSTIAVAEDRRQHRDEPSPARIAHPVSTRTLILPRTLTLTLRCRQLLAQYGNVQEPRHHKASFCISDPAHDPDPDLDPSPNQPKPYHGPCKQRSSRQFPQCRRSQSWSPARRRPTSGALPSSGATGACTSTRTSSRCAPSARWVACCHRRPGPKNSRCRCVCHRPRTPVVVRCITEAYWLIQQVSCMQRHSLLAPDESSLPVSNILSHTVVDVTACNLAGDLAQRVRGVGHGARGRLPPVAARVRAAAPHHRCALPGASRSLPCSGAIARVTLPYPASTCTVPRRPIP